MSYLVEIPDDRFSCVTALFIAVGGENTTKAKLQICFFMKTWKPVHIICISMLDKIIAGAYCLFKL